MTATRAQCRNILFQFAIVSLNLAIMLITLYSIDTQWYGIIWLTLFFLLQSGTIFIRTILNKSLTYVHGPSVVQIASRRP